MENTISLLPTGENIHSSKNKFKPDVVVANIYWKDPPLIFKSFLMRELSLTKAFIEYDSSKFSVNIDANGISSTSGMSVDFVTLLMDPEKEIWLRKLLVDMYSILSVETVPLAKLLLHAKSFISPSSTPIANLTEHTKALITGATLSRSGKPVISPLYLFSYSATFNSVIIPMIATIETTANATIGVDLLNIMRSFGEVVNATVHSPIVNYISKLLKDSALSPIYGQVSFKRFIQLLSTPSNEDNHRSPLHALFLAGPSAASMINGLCDLIETASSIADNDWQADVVNVKKVLHEAIFGVKSVDSRGHTPFSYFLTRWIKSNSSEGSSESIKKLALLIGIDYDEAIRNHTTSPVTDESEFFNAGNDLDISQQSSSGGWDTSSIDLADSTRCDITEVWSDDNVLPNSREFFEKYVNTATPVVFRYNWTASLVRQEKLKQLKGRSRRKFVLKQPRIDTVRQSLRKDVFLDQFGSVVVPVSVIPYAGSFGAKTSFAPLAEVAQANNAAEVQEYLNLLLGVSNSDSPLSLSSSLKDKVPLYSFSTPSQQWSRQLQQDVTIPESMTCTPSHVSDCSHMGSFQSSPSSSPVAWPFEIQFYLGAAGTGSPVHFHGHAINTLAYGEKNWYLWPPGLAMYSTISAIELVTLLESRTAESPSLRPLRCTQRAGDVMFVPTLWAHATFNSQQSIGVAHEFSTESYCMQ